MLHNLYLSIQVHPYRFMLADISDNLDIMAELMDEVAIVFFIVSAYAILINHFIITSKYIALRIIGYLLFCIVILPFFIINGFIVLGYMGNYQVSRTAISLIGTFFILLYAIKTHIIKANKRLSVSDHQEETFLNNEKRAIEYQKGRYNNQGKNKFNIWD